ncbi:MAG: hypothetical protein RXR08_14585 [Sulfolobaceae archaeon]
MYTGKKMAKLSRKEFKEMKKRALTQLRHLVLGYDIGTFVENGCIKVCKGYEKIEVLDAPDLTGRIVVRGNGFDCVSICAGDAEFLQNYIDVLKEFVGEIMKAKDNPSNFDKEKIKEAYSAVLNLKAYLSKLLPFTQS